MKTSFTGGGKIGIKILLALLICCQGGFAQGFVNLNFENATVTFVNPEFPNYIYANTAIPGWSAYFGNSTTPASEIYYNGQSLGGAAVFLEDTNNISPKPIQGTYSVLLQGSSASTPTSAAIGQTGTISASVQSLTFFGVGGNFQVTFNGQPISYLITGSTANYNIYGADISGYAGQTGELRFTGLSPSYALIDNIQFSTTAIPEPSTFALVALGGLLLSFRRRGFSA